MAIEKNMDAMQFALEYKNLATKTLKNNYLKEKLIFESYVPIMTKINTCENLVSTTMQEVENGKITGFRMNSPARYIIYSLTMVNLYTNLIVDFSNATAVFDALNETDLLDIILEKIPEKETHEFAKIKDMVQKDFLNNKFNIYNFTEEQITKATVLFGTFANEGLDKLNNLLDHMDMDGIQKGFTKGAAKFVEILSKVGLK